MGYVCNQSVPALPRQRRAHAHRDRCRARPSSRCSPSCARAARRRSTSPAARPSSIRISATWCARPARSACSVIDRCNLTILCEPGHEDLARVPRRASEVEIVASLPCYTRGATSTASAARACTRRSIARHPRAERAGLRPRRLGPRAAPRLQPAGRRSCRRRRRRSRPTTSASWASASASRSTASSRSPTCRSSASARRSSPRASSTTTWSCCAAPTATRTSRRVMCRSLVSVDWQGYLYDCDFNQMLGLPLRVAGRSAHAPRRRARPRPRRQPDRRARPLLRLHRGPGLELRRRARVSRDGTGAVRVAGAPRGSRRRAHLPASYRYPPRVFDRAPEIVADTLYVVGRALRQRRGARRVLALARASAPAHARLQRRLPLVRRGAGRFRARRREALAHPALRGNVETEIAGEDSGAGCGCAYPAGRERRGRDRAPTRSSSGCARPRARSRQLRERSGRAADAPRRARGRRARGHRARRCGVARRLGLRAGPARRPAPRALDRERVPRRAASTCSRAATPACRPAARSIRGGGVVINNGAAGMPNFDGDPVRRRHAHLQRPARRGALRHDGSRRSSSRRSPSSYDTAAGCALPRAWPEGSPGTPYFRRIAHGPGFARTRALPAAA